MPATTSADTVRNINEYISQHRLRDAFRELRCYSAKLGDWRTTDEIDSIEQSYSMMLRYAAGGTEDPSQHTMYESIVARMLRLMDSVSRRLEQSVSPTLYYSTLRYEAMSKGCTLSSLFSDYFKLQDKASFLNLIVDEKDSSSSAEEIEALERRIFNRLWVTYPISAESDEVIRHALASDALPEHFKDLLISSLLLGLTFFYDERRLDILLDIYGSSSSVKLQMHALCAALMTMYVNRDRLTSERLRKRIESLRDTTQWHDDVGLVFLQFIRSRDTERINRKMNDEVIPKMMKLRPDIAKRLNRMNNISDMDDLNENPEWQELLDESGITDKIKELTKIQEDGGDVFMSTFSNLKSFPFFSDIANWFLTFRADHSIVSKSLGKEDARKLGGIIESSRFLCEGDKFSFLLALSSVPEAQRRLMMSQFDTQHISDLELQNSMLNQEAETRDNIAGKYVQGLYRFFKLFRRRGEFNDPFRRPLNLLVLGLLEDDLTDNDTLALVSEFYFKRGYYEDAYNVYKLLSDKSVPDAQLYQKLGYCLQQMDDIQGALKYYEQAELLNADSIWTQRRLGLCYKLLGRYSEAIAHYKLVESKRPDELGVSLNIGHCYLELNQPKEALHYYYKVEFLDEKSNKALRPIAWCLFLMGDFEQSRQYYERVLLDSPTVTDYLNMGHVNLSLGDIKEALNYYGLSIDLVDGDIEKFISDFNADKSQLIASGVKPSLLPLIIDTLLYARD